MDTILAIDWGKFNSDFCRYGANMKELPICITRIMSTRLNVV
jgi:hypothetical protein